MNYKQILEVLKASGMSIDDFAYNETPYSEFSEAANKAQSVKELWYKDNPAPKYPSPEYDKWNKTYQSLPSKYDVARSEWLKANNIPEWEEISQKGGEGEGDHWESVKYFKDHDVYIKVVGHYSSYDGTDFYNEWNSCYEVKPVEKVVTFYE